MVEATFTVVVLLAEAPTGYLGDRIGRRNGMLVGTVLAGLGVAGYALATALPVALSGLGGLLLVGSLLALAAWLPATHAARTPPPSDGG